MKNVLKMLTYIREVYWQLFGTALASLVIALASALQPQVFKSVLDTLIDEAGNGQSWTLLIPKLLIMMGLSLVFILGSHFFNVLSEYTYNRVDSIVHIKVFEALSSQSVEFFETHQAGKILQRTYRSIADFTNWISTFNYSFLGPIFSLFFITLFLAIKSPWLGLLSIGVIAYSYFDVAHTRKKATPHQKKTNVNFERAYGTFSETLTHFSTIQTTSTIDYFRTKFNQDIQAGLGAYLKNTTLWNWSLLRRTLFNEAAYMLAIVISVGLVLQQKATAGDLLALIAYFTLVRANAGQFSDFVPRTVEADISTGRLIKTIEQEPTLADTPGAIQLKNLDKIEFRNVTFSYPGVKKPAVQDISFVIAAGTNTALVGPSGVGKSTLTKLLLRFYQPTSGQILINDKPVEAFTMESIRSHMGVVMQDVALFNTTIKENLLLARPRVSLETIKRAATQAHADEFIRELPKQYQTLVGERGIKLSGGQKQRIAITRAILKDPQFIILDEATSALDSESEKFVQEGLARLRTGRSSLTIAHRLSTVQHANEILVLKDGKISERGTHTELIKKPKGLYKKLFDLQSATGKVRL